MGRARSGARGAAFFAFLAGTVRCVPESQTRRGARKRRFSRFLPGIRGHGKGFDQWVRGGKGKGFDSEFGVGNRPARTPEETPMRCHVLTGPEEAGWAGARRGGKGAAFFAFSAGYGGGKGTRPVGPGDAPIRPEPLGATRTHHPRPDNGFSRHTLPARTFWATEHIILGLTGIRSMQPARLSAEQRS